MPYPPARRYRELILESQKRDVEHCIANAGLSVSDFGWDDAESQKTQGLLVTSLVYVPKPGYFVFDFERHEDGTALRYSLRSPGLERKSEQVYADSWNAQYNQVAEWLLALRQEMDPEKFSSLPHESRSKSPGSGARSAEGQALDAEVKIFISHSSGDAGIAESVADLFKFAYGHRDGIAMVLIFGALDQSSSQVLEVALGTGITDHVWGNAGRAIFQGLQYHGGSR